MPFAFEAGLSEDEFWCDDKEIVDMRCRAYERRMDKEAWLQGNYTFEALLSIVTMMFPNKGEKPYVYPNEPHSQKNKAHNITSKAVKANIEDTYRDTLNNFR